MKKKYIILLSLLSIMITMLFFYKQKIESIFMPHFKNHFSVLNNSSTIDFYLKSVHFNGSAFVVKNGEVLLNKGYGYSDIDKKNKNSPETKFYIASASKIFVSVSIMQLQDEGKLNINDPVSKYIPDFEEGQPITLFNLLSQTSGIPTRKEPKIKISPKNLVEKIGKSRLVSAPGEKWNYSDSNYSVLAYIVEKVSHESYHDYVKDHIFNKLNMKNTGFGEDFYNEKNQSIGYKKSSYLIPIVTIPPITDFSQVFGSGDIYSTTHDLYLFDKALYNGKLISKESLTRVFTPFKHTYGLGIYKKSKFYVDHGLLGGWDCLNSFSTNGNEYVILFSNIRQKNPSILYSLNNTIFKIISKGN